MSLQVWLPLNGNINNQGLTQLNYTTQGNFEYIENGKIGKAISSGQITMSAENMQNIFSKGECSICFWIYVNAETGSTATSDRPMLFGNNTNRRYSLFQYPTCNDFHFSWWKNDQGNTESFSNVCTNAFPSYTWTHAAITYKNKTVTIYINGQKKFNETRSYDYSPVSLNYDTILFTNNNNKRYLNDYRIYDHCLSQKEIEEISKGLVLHYPLNNHYLAENNTIYDTSGYCNNGTIVGSLTAAASSPRYNCATNFNGNNSTYIQIPTLTLDWSKISFSAWGKWNSFNNWSRIFDFGNGSNGADWDICLANYSTSSYIGLGGRTGNGAAWPDTKIIEKELTANTWYHLVETIENNICKIYINGSLMKTITLTNTPSVITLTQNYLGKSNWSNNSPFNGSICDFRIYTTVLSTEQIKELYNTSMGIDSSGNIYARELVEE